MTCSCRLRIRSSLGISNRSKQYSDPPPRSDLSRPVGSAVRGTWQLGQGTPIGEILALSEVGRPKTPVTVGTFSCRWWSDLESVLPPDEFPAHREAADIEVRVLRRRNLSL